MFFTALRTSGAYLRFEDRAEGSGNFYPESDRLTGKQLQFENVIVLIADHEALKAHIVDIKLGLGYTGKAYLFRDGQVSEIYWTTANGDYEQQTGLRRPIRFVDASGSPVALKPGHTWVHVMSQYSFVEQQAPGEWRARFIAPKGSE
jgi:hypothetical protein